MYNATVFELKADTKGSMRIAQVFLAELDNKGRMTRSSALQNTGLEGSHAYHKHFLSVHPGSTLEITLDGGLGYESMVNGGVPQKSPQCTSISYRRAHPRPHPSKPRDTDTD
jgi:hypothetical protein